MIIKCILSLAIAAALMCGADVAAAQDKASQKFIKEAIEGNLSEIQVGQLAQQKGQNDDVKAFGRMLQQDHSDANQKATQVAGQLNVTPPSEPGKQDKAVYDRLAKLPAGRFDHQFARAMVADHKKDIRAFEKQAKKNDAAGQFATQALPILRKHLETAVALEKRGGLPAR